MKLGGGFKRTEMKFLNRRIKLQHDNQNQGSVDP